MCNLPAAAGVKTPAAKDGYVAAEAATHRAKHILAGSAGMVDEKDSGLKT